MTGHPDSTGPIVSTAPSSLRAVMAADTHGGRTVRITGQAPWVDVEGDLEDDGCFEATGKGTVAGFPHIEVSFTGTFDDETGTLHGDDAMDTGKVIHAKHPTIYRVELERQ